VHLVDVVCQVVYLELDKLTLEKVVETKLDTKDFSDRLA